MRLLLVVLAALALEGCSEAEASAYRCRESRLGRLTGCDPRPATTTVAAAPPNYVQFQMAPDSGVGMGTECAGTVPVPASDAGGSLSFARASAAYCQKADGTLVALTTDQPAIQVKPYTSTGPLGIIYEPSETISSLWSEEFDQAGTWTATAAVTANSDVAPDLTTTADLLTDSSAGAIQGVTQNLGFTCAGCDGFAPSVFVAPGNQSGLTLSMTGVGNSLGDATCSIADVTASTQCVRVGSGSWYRCACLGAAYGVGLSSVNFFVGVGSSAATQGTLKVWGFNVPQPQSTGFGVTSYVKTTTVPVTRAPPVMYISTPASVTTAGPSCAGFEVAWPSVPTTWVVSSVLSGGASGAQGFTSVSRVPFFASGVGSVRNYDGVNQSSGSSCTTTQLNAGARVVGMWGPSGINGWSTCGGLGTINATYGNNLGSPWRLGRAEAGGGAGSPLWFTDIRYDSSSTGCE